MPLVIGDYLSDTMNLTTEQHGAYILLLIASWKMGAKLPNDEEQLAAICKLDLERWRKHSGLILGFFSVIDGFLIQKRLKEEFDKAGALSNRNRVNGASGGRPKTQKEPKHNPDTNPEKTPSPSPSHSNNTHTDNNKNITLDWYPDELLLSEISANLGVPVLELHNHISTFAAHYDGKHIEHLASKFQKWCAKAINFQDQDRKKRG